MQTPQIIDGSPKFSFNQLDWKKHGIMLLKLLAGAVLTYLTQVVPDLDFGKLTPLIMALFTAMVDLATRYLRDNQVPLALDTPRDEM